MTDIGHSVNKEALLNKFAAQVPKKSNNIMNKKMRWKMASATNPNGISAEEYSVFAIHVYRILSWIKTVDVPSLEELRDNDKLVEIGRKDDHSILPKSTILVFLSIYNNFITKIWEALWWLGVFFLLICSQLEYKLIDYL